MRKTAVYRDDLFLEHMKDFNHVESASRLEIIYNELDKPEIGAAYLFPSFGPVSQEILALNHTSDYIKRVAGTAGQSFVSLDPDTQTSARSYEAAILAAGAAVTATEQVMRGEIDNAFCLVRPPGHHAEHNRAMGFCLFNNVAVATHYAIKELQLDRVLIVDWDLHHGNGTQNAFYDTDKVLYFSTHQYPYYPGTGSASEVGEGLGEGYTINVPLSAGLENQAYATIFNELLGPLAREYKPQLIILSAGYDIHLADPLGGMGVTDAGFAYMAKVMLDLALELCDNRFVACLEGGYGLSGLRDGVMATLGEMVGQTTMRDKTIIELSTSAVPVMAMEHTKEIAQKYWNI